MQKLNRRNGRSQEKEIALVATNSDPGPGQLRCTSGKVMKERKRERENIHKFITTRWWNPETLR